MSIFGIFKSKIDSDINVAISSPKISGYGLKDLVTKMFSVKEFANELAEPEKILENKRNFFAFGFYNFVGFTFFI